MLDSKIHTLSELSYNCNRKDKVPEYPKSHIVYEFCCPACNIKYTGKTDRSFGTRIQVHSGLDKKSPVYTHLLECEHFNNVVILHSLPPSNNSVEYLRHSRIAVYGNTKIIDKRQNWVELYLLESLYIKRKKAKLNFGIKATKKLLFLLYH